MYKHLTTLKVKFLNEYQQSKNHNNFQIKFKPQFSSYFMKGLNSEQFHFSISKAINYLHPTKIVSQL